VCRSLTDSSVLALSWADPAGSLGQAQGSRANSEKHNKKRETQTGEHWWKAESKAATIPNLANRSIEQQPIIGNVALQLLARFRIRSFRPLLCRDHAPTKHEATPGTD
jgi:hypothetical protein